MVAMHGYKMFSGRRSDTKRHFYPVRSVPMTSFARRLRNDIGCYEQVPQQIYVELQRRSSKNIHTTTNSNQRTFQNWFDVCWRIPLASHPETFPTIMYMYRNQECQDAETCCARVRLVRKLRRHTRHCRWLLKRCQSNNRRSTTKNWSSPSRPVRWQSSFVISLRIGNFPTTENVRSEQNKSMCKTSIRVFLEADRFVPRSPYFDVSTSCCLDGRLKTMTLWCAGFSPMQLIP